MKIKENDFLQCVASYLAALLFTNDDDNGDAMDLNFGLGDFDGAFYEQCKDDLARFYELAEEHLALTEYANAAIDLVYTRNHEGAGFWDGDWDKGEDSERGEKLSAIVRDNFKEVEIYVGDDGLIYG